MSTEAATSAVVPARHHHGLRLTLAAVTALVAGWYGDNALVVLLAPILTVIVMGPGSAAPGPKAALVGPLAIWLGAGAIATTATFLAGQDLTLLALLAAAVFLCFRSDAVHGPKPLTGLVLMLVVTVAPMSAAAAPLADPLVDAMAIGLLIAMFCAMLAHALLPGPPPEARAAALPWTADRALRVPLGKTVLLMALVGWFVITDKTGGLYILITAATVLRIPRVGDAAVGLVASNLLGGALALGVAGIIATTPGSLFTVILFALMILVLGLMIEGGGARGAIAQGAVSVAIILFMMGVLPVDGSSVFIERVGEVAATIIYVLLGRIVIEPPVRAEAA